MQTLGQLQSKSQIITSIGKNVEKLKPLYTADRNIEWPL